MQARPLVMASDGAASVMGGAELRLMHLLGRHGRPVALCQGHVAVR